MMNTVITAALIALLTGTGAVTAVNPVGSYVTAEETAITEEEQAIYDEAAAELIGFHYIPVQMIEKQIVNGTNYKFIAKSTSAPEGSKPKTVMVTIHQSLSGEISVIDILHL